MIIVKVILLHGMVVTFIIIRANVYTFQYIKILCIHQHSTYIKMIYTHKKGLSLIHFVRVVRVCVCASVICIRHRWCLTRFMCSTDHTDKRSTERITEMSLNLNRAMWWRVFCARSSWYYCYKSNKLLGFLCRLMWLFMVKPGFISMQIGAIVCDDVWWCGHSSEWINNFLAI